MKKNLIIIFLTLILKSFIYIVGLMILLNISFIENKYFLIALIIYILIVLPAINHGSKKFVNTYFLSKCSNNFFNIFYFLPLALFLSINSWSFISIILINSLFVNLPYNNSDYNIYLIYLMFIIISIYTYFYLNSFFKASLNLEKFKLKESFIYKEFYINSKKWLFEEEKMCFINKSTQIKIDLINEVSLIDLFVKIKIFYIISFISLFLSVNNNFKDKNLGLEPILNKIFHYNIQYIGNIKIYFPDKYSNKDLQLIINYLGELNLIIENIEFKESYDNKSDYLIITINNNDYNTLIIKINDILKNN